MKPVGTQLRDLVQLLCATEEEEFNCEEVLDRVAQYAECESKPSELCDELIKVRLHLSICPECTEEFEALIEHMKQIDSVSQQDDHEEQ